MWYTATEPAPCFRLPGLSLLFGTLLGDFVGGGAVVIAAKSLIQSSYSREVEQAADTYGVRLMGRLGVDATALAAMLRRIDGDRRPGMRIWLDHPQVDERVRNINALAPRVTGRPARCLAMGGTQADLRRRLR